MEPFKHEIDIKFMALKPKPRESKQVITFPRIPEIFYWYKPQTTTGGCFNDPGIPVTSR